MPKTWQDELDEAWEFFRADCYRAYLLECVLCDDAWRAVALRVSAAYVRYQLTATEFDDALTYMMHTGCLVRLFTALDALAQEGE